MSEHTVVTASLQNSPRMHIKRGCRAKNYSCLTDRQQPHFTQLLSVLHWNKNNRLIHSLQIIHARKVDLPPYNESIAASFLNSVLGRWSAISPLTASFIQTIRTKTGFNNSFVKSLHFIWSFNRKPIFDPFLQISVLGPDTLGRFAMLAVAMTACSHHGLGGLHSGASSVQGGNCQDTLSVGELWAKFTSTWTKPAYFGLKSCLLCALILRRLTFMLFL